MSIDIITAIINKKIDKRGKLGSGNCRGGMPRRKVRTPQNRAPDNIRGQRCVSSPLRIAPQKIYRLGIFPR